MSNIESKIAKLHLESGDVLVVKLNRQLDKDQLRAVRDGAKRFVPNNEVMVLVGAEVVVRRGGEFAADEALEWD